MQSASGTPALGPAVPAGKSPAAGRSIKGGLAVFFLCVLVGSIGGFIMVRNAQVRIQESQNLVLGLIYFMEQHGGRLPESLDEFLASPFIERKPAGGDAVSVVIHPYPQSGYRKDPRPIVIDDLNNYTIDWGVDLGTLTADERGEFRDPKGATVKVFQWRRKGAPALAGSSSAPKVYVAMLVDASREIRERAAASQPAAAPDRPAVVQTRPAAAPPAPAPQAP